MKDQINTDNYEIVFFQLTEGEYTKEIEEQLLKTIANDSFLSFEWENWKKSQLSNNDLNTYQTEYSEFFEGIKNEALLFNTKKDKQRNKVLPLFWALGSVAAVLLIAVVHFGTSDVRSHQGIAEAEVMDQITPQVTDLIVPLYPPKDTTSKPQLENKAQTIEIRPYVQEHIQALEEVNDTIQVLPSIVVETPQFEVTDHITIDSNKNENDSSFIRLAQTSEFEQLLEQIDTTFIASKSHVASNKQRNLKFTVEKSKLPPQIILTSLAQLSEMNIDVSALMEDQKVFVMRNADGLFLRLEKDGGEILIALR